MHMVDMYVQLCSFVSNLIQLMVVPEIMNELSIVPPCNAMLFLARARGQSDEVVNVQSHKCIRRQPQLRISLARGSACMLPIIVITTFVPYGWCEVTDHVNKILTPKANKRSCWRRGQTIGKHVFFKSTQHH